MTLLRPVWRATVRKPRSEDLTEAGVLTGIGTVHSELFKVATITGLAGFQGYLDLPDGRQGKHNLKERKTDVGQMTFRVLDRQLTPGGSQALRWVSGFPGGLAADGRTRWLGCQWETEYSSDGGTTFAPWFTGRIAAVDVEENWVSFTIQGKTRDFVEAECFVGRPHASIAYVAETSLVPVGITADYGTVKAVPALAGTFGNASHGTGKSIAVASASVSHPRNVITRAFRRSDGRQYLVPRGQTTTMRPVARDAEYRCRIAYGASSGDVRILGYKMYHRPEGHYALTEVWVEALNPTDANYVALPANGTAVTWRVATALREPTSEAPLLIGDVHPLQLAADLLDGKYAFLNADGSVRRAYARDGATWAAMIADQSWGTVRFRIDKKEKLLKFIESQLCKVCGFGIREDAQGRIVPFDLRLPNTLAGIPTLTDDDLDEATPVRWGEALEDSFSRFQVKYYIDDVLTPEDLADAGGYFPDLPACLLESIEVDPPYEERFLDEENEDAGIRTLTIDAKGLRITPNETADLLARIYGGMSSLDVIEGRCRELLRQYEKPFATGAKPLRFTCRRTPTAEALQVGALVVTAFSTQLNPAINARGGTLLGRVVEKRERGGKIEFQTIFLGPGVVCGTPTIGVVVAGADPLHEISVPVTLHADGSPVLVRVALTEKAVGVRPADASPLWVTMLARLTANGNYTIRNLPAGKRAWVQGRAEPKTTGKDRALPSLWANAGGTGYLDLTDLPAPVSIAVAGVSQKKADLTLDLGGNTTFGVRLLLGYGASQAAADASTPTQLVDLLPGTLKYTLYGLDGPGAGTWYRLQVQLFDSFGGVSAVVGTAPTSFQATGANTQAPTPAGVQILAGTPVTPLRLAAIANPRDGAVGQLERSGIAATILPAQLGLDLVCRLAPDVAGAPGAWVEVDQIPAAVITAEGYTWSTELPADDVTRWVSFMHRGVGWDDSIPTEGLAVKPGPLPRQKLPFLTQGPVARERALAGSARSVLQLQTWLWPNAEFDLWGSDGVTPAGHTVDLQGGGVISRQVAPLSGDYALRYSNPDNGTNGGWHGISTNDPKKGAFCIPLRPGVKYRLLIASRASVVANGERFRVTLDFGAGGTLTKTFVYQDWGHAAGLYGALFEYPLTVPTNADPNTKGTIEFSRNGSAAATDFDLDSIRLDEETADYETLSQQIQDEGYIISINGDYEQDLAYWEIYRPAPSGVSALSIDTVTFEKGRKALKVHASISSTQTLIHQSKRTTNENVEVGTTATVRAARVREGDILQIRGSIRLQASGPVVYLGVRYWGPGDPTAGAGTAVALARASSAAIGAWESVTGFLVVPAGVAWAAVYMQIDSQGSGTDVWFDDVVLARVLTLPCVKVYNPTGTDIVVANNTPVILTFSTEQWDVGGFHSTVSQTSRLTIPSTGGKYDGYFDLSAQVTFEANTNNYRRLRIMKNGTQQIAIAHFEAVSVEMSVQIVGQDRNPAPGDYYEVEAFQTSGGNLNVVGGHDAAPNPDLATKTWFTMAYRR